MASRDEIRAATRACAEILATQLDDVAHRVGDGLEAGFPELVVDADMAREFAASVRANLTTGVSVLAGDTPADTARVPEAAVGFARTLVHRQVGIDRLLEVYRVGHAQAWCTWMDVLVEHVEDRAVLGGALQRSADDLNRYVERVVARLVDEFRRERERWTRLEVARRSDTVQRILRDTGSRTDVDETSAELGHELRAVQTAIVLWSALPADVVPVAAAVRLDRTAQDLAAALGVARALVVPVGASSVWAWFATDEPVTRTALTAAMAAVRPDGVQVAAGGSGTGLDGFRASHRQALRAQHVAQRGPAPSGLTAYEDVGALAVITDDEHAIDDFVTRELGALAGPEHALLRETLRVYLDCGGSAPRAASTLRTHRNTVLYRLRHAAPLVGHPLDERRLELALALRLEAISR